MTQTLRPRTVTSVLVEEQPNTIVVTGGLGEPIETAATPEYFGYGVDYYDPDGNRGKRASASASATRPRPTSSTSATPTRRTTTPRACRLTTTR